MTSILPQSTAPRDSWPRAPYNLANHDLGRARDKGGVRALTKLTRHGQITLPKAVRERPHLAESDYIDVEISEDDRGIVLRPRKLVAIDPDQEWF